MNTILATSYAFHFKNGIMAHSLYEFYSILKFCSIHIFDYHKYHFPDWLSNILGYKYLAEKISKIVNMEDLKVERMLFLCLEKIEKVLNPHSQEKIQEKTQEKTSSQTSSQTSSVTFIKIWSKEHIPENIKSEIDDIDKVLWVALVPQSYLKTPEFSIPWIECSHFCTGILITKPYDELTMQYISYASVSDVENTIPISSVS